MHWLFRFRLMYGLAKFLRKAFSVNRERKVQQDRENGYLARNFKGRKVINVNFTVEEDDGKGDQNG